MNSSVSRVSANRLYGASLAEGFVSVDNSNLRTAIAVVDELPKIKQTRVVDKSTIPADLHIPHFLEAADKFKCIITMRPISEKGREYAPQENYSTKSGDAKGKTEDGLLRRHGDSTPVGTLSKKGCDPSIIAAFDCCQHQNVALSPESKKPISQDYDIHSVIAIEQLESTQDKYYSVTDGISDEDIQGVFSTFERDIFKTINEKCEKKMVRHGPESRHPDEHSESKNYPLFVVLPDNSDLINKVQEHECFSARVDGNPRTIILDNKQEFKLLLEINKQLNPNAPEFKPHPSW